MDVCGPVGGKSTWEQITFYVETIKQSTTIKGLENYGLSFSEAMGAEGVHESVHAKVYLLKTTKTEFDSGAPSAGISKNTLKATIAFIKK
nr:MAG TPA: hypothetical protein [Caudoviricetes sp.]